MTITMTRIDNRRNEEGMKHRYNYKCCRLVIAIHFCRECRRHAHEDFAILADLGRVLCELKLFTLARMADSWRSNMAYGRGGLLSWMR